MKSFNDFWSTIAQEDVDEMSKKIELASLDIQSNSLNELLGNSIAATSLIITKSILEKYHFWLCEQLNLSPED